VARQKERLTQQERHAQIAALLRHEGTVRIATLAKEFDVTTETVRRDLDELAEKRRAQANLRGRREPLVDGRARHRRRKPNARAERGLIARAAAEWSSPATR
jgi:DeoR/GlpR family transcriptional regulator of sugar metabolism